MVKSKFTMEKLICFVFDFSCKLISDSNSNYFEKSI